MKNKRTFKTIGGKIFFHIQFLSLFVAAATIASCDDEFYSFAKKMSDYGPQWSYSESSSSAGVVTVIFPQSVANADNAVNYSVQYDGTSGSVTLGSASYDDATFVATLQMSFSGTNGESFRIEIVSSDTPITMGTKNLDGYTSPSFSTPGGSITVAWSSGGLATLDSTAYIYATFSQDVSNADDIANYQAVYTGASGGSVSINTVTYDAATRVASLYVICTNTDGSSVSFNIINGGNPIASGSMTLTSGSSQSYNTPDTVSPTILSWNPASGSTVSPASATIVITFSEDVVNAGEPGSYTYSGSETGSITAITYDSDTHTATLTVVTSGPAGGTFYISVNGGSITDASGNIMPTQVPASYSVP